MKLPELFLKKNEDRRLRAGHLWIYSNEIDTKKSSLKSFQVGETVVVKAADNSILGYAYVNPYSLIAARIFSKDKRETLDEDFFLKKFTKALASRENFFSKPFYRLIHGESDWLPGIIIDRFNEHLVIQITTAGMEARKEDIVSALKKLLPATKSILFRNTSSVRELEKLEKYIEAGFGETPEKVLLEENDVQFYAPLLKGQKTGWFYDHRLNRSRLKDYVKNKKVLDLFCYLGGWGIQALSNGAEHVTFVDASELALKYVEENATLNNFRNFTTICNDAFKAIKELQTQQKKFDVIILDPPAFIKKLKDKKEGTIAYQRLNEAALKLLTPGGILFSCSCSMLLSEEDLLQVLRRASINTHIPIQVIERGHQAQDHPVHPAIPETDYLKMVVVRAAFS